MSFQTTPAIEEAEQNIVNDGFFPDIVMAEAREAMRIDSTVTEQRLRHALIEAIAGANDELADWQQSQVNDGYATLIAVPSPQLAGKSKNVYRYLRAVYASAAADLAERYRSFDTTNEGNRRADELDPAIDDLKRNYRFAINDLLGISRATIELI